MLLILTCALLALPMCMGEVHYDGHQVRRLVPTHSAQLEVLKDLEKNAHRLELDFWTSPTGLEKPIFLQISPNYLSKVLAGFDFYNITSEVTIPDIQVEIEREKQELSQPSKTAFDLGRYHNLAEINRWMNRLILRYPHLVRVYSAGVSYEGRIIRGIRINSPSRNKTAEKPIFWFYGGVHAREWIGPATVIYMTEQLLARYTEEDRVANVVDYFDWYIVPVANVDGYEYSWKTDRLWRKTRSKSGSTGCFGVDANRNFDIHWGEEGASRDPCNDNYCGPSAFSEVEIRSMVALMKPMASRIHAFIDFHSFSQKWMTPWAYTTDLPEDYIFQDQSSVVAVTALGSLYGTKFTHGNLASILYQASGSSVDYVYDTLKIKYSYGVELRDTGTYGFLLPVYQIIPSGKETFRGLLGVAEYIKQNFN